MILFNRILRGLMVVILSTILLASNICGVNASKVFHKREYVVLTNDNDVYNKDMTELEARRLENEGNIIGEELEVRASSNEIFDGKNIKKIKLTKEEKKDLRNTWNMRAIKADKVKKNKKANKVKIAIIDSGVDLSNDLT